MEFAAMLCILLVLPAAWAFVPDQLVAQNTFPESLPVEKKPLSSSTSTILYKDWEGTRMVEAIYDQSLIGKDQMVDCFIMADKQVSQEFLSSFPAEHTVILTKSQLQEVLDECSSLLLTHLLDGKLHSFTESNLTRGALSRGIFDVLLIFPGTKWCGAGNIASHYEDLGKARETDMCCREHDHCTESINAGGEKYNLVNKAIYTKSHCDCDRKFRGCLKTNDAIVSNTVGCLFFNLLQAQCFAKDYPIVRCLEHSGWIPWIYWSCQRYELDASRPKIWQFMDAKKY